MISSSWWAGKCQSWDMNPDLLTQNSVRTACPRAAVRALRVQSYFQAGTHKQGLQRKPGQSGSLFQDRDPVLFPSVSAVDIGKTRHEWWVKEGNGSGTPEVPSGMQHQLTDWWVLVIQHHSHQGLHWEESNETFHSSCSTVAEAVGICYLPSWPFEDFQKQPWATSKVRAGASREGGGRREPLKTEAVMFKLLLCLKIGS